MEATIRTVTKDEWQAAVRQGNAGLDYAKTPYMLWYEEGVGTVWGAVRIGQTCTACGEALEPFQGFWVHAETEIPDHQPTYPGGEGVHQPA